MCEEINREKRSNPTAKSHMIDISNRSRLELKGSGLNQNRECRPGCGNDYAFGLNGAAHLQRPLQYPNRPCVKALEQTVHEDHIQNHRNTQSVSMST